MGTLRLLLAFCVVATHGGGKLFGLPLPPGEYAVQAFFIISGFFITMVLNTGYQGAHSLRDFYATRLVRILPLYYIALLAAILMHVMLDKQATGVPYQVHMLSESALHFYVATQITPLGQHLYSVLCLPYRWGECSDRYIALLPSAWSLTPELLFYMMAPFVLRSQRRCLLLLLVGAAYQYGLTQLPDPVLASPPFRPELHHQTLSYLLLPASWVFFGMGALAWHATQQGRRCIIYAALLLVPLLLQGMHSYMPWWHLWLWAVLVPLLFWLTRDITWDRWLGRLSYPLYLIHTVLCDALNYMGIHYPGSQLSQATLACALPAAMLLLYVVERPIERWRHRQFLH